MKTILMGALVAVLAAASYPAYADEYLENVNHVLDAWTDLRNNYLIENFFGESYPTPETAAMETVSNAIEMYELTRAAPQVQVTERGTFVSHPLNPYGTPVVAFDVINSMRTLEEVYPFVIDAGTLDMLAEGAFPGTVGLYATFLEDADRPLNIILQDLQDSDGTWVSYTFENPSIGMSQVKHVWLTLHDGYIFGSGYYESSDVQTIEAVESLIRMYDAAGTGSFASIHADQGESFVLDAGTMHIITHTNADATSSAIRDAISTDWDLDVISGMLDRHGSMWVSYPSITPYHGGEYARAYLQLHDGHIFGSSYGIFPEARVQSLVDEVITLYKLEGAGAFPIITSLSLEPTSLAVVGVMESKVLAYAGSPAAVGQTVILSSIFDQDADTLLQSLRDNPGLWLDTIFIDSTSVASVELRRSTWLVLHDGHLFAAGHIYSPEARSVGIVNEAIETYKIHGEKAFDRITWQSVRPEIVYPFVVDAQTWELVAHGALPERVGVCCAAPIAASNDLDAARQALEQNPGIWLEYTFYNPIAERYDFKRTYLSTYDGYTFAAGYYYANLDQLDALIQEGINLYDTAGQDAAFASINAMMTTGALNTFVLDQETLDIAAHSRIPALAGTNIGVVINNYEFLQGHLGAKLQDDGDTAVTYIIYMHPETGASILRLTLFQLHDGYIFAVDQPYTAYTR